MFFYTVCAVKPCTVTVLPILVYIPSSWAKLNITGKETLFLFVFSSSVQWAQNDKALFRLPWGLSELKYVNHMRS